MSKLILMSGVIAMFVIPIRAARGKSAKKALNKVFVQSIIFGAFYLFALKYLWGRF